MHSCFINNNNYIQTQRFILKCVCIYIYVCVCVCVCVFVYVCICIYVCAFVYILYINHTMHLKEYSSVSLIHGLTHRDIE